jgi:hypothetical protein
MNGRLGAGAAGRGIPRRAEMRRHLRRGGRLREPHKILRAKRGLAAPAPLCKSNQWAEALKLRAKRANFREEQSERCERMRRANELKLAY